VFVRQVLTSVTGGGDGGVPLEYSQEAYDEYAPQLFDRLAELARRCGAAGRRTRSRSRSSTGCSPTARWT
jgi:hypothetical protein